MSDNLMDLSIIIPVYNHEKYIKKCLETILYDLPENTEIIIIDDYSTDNSIDIVRTFNSDNIKIIQNKKNMGCAYSLNKALNFAKGKYIGTNNSDDFVEKGFYKQMLIEAKKTNADIVCANIADYNDSTNEAIYNKIEYRNLYIDTINQKINFDKNAIEVDVNLLLGHWTASSASTKIIKKELLEKYKYIGSKANDLTTIYPIMAEAKKVIYMPQLYMFYRQVPNSLSRRNTEEEYNSVVDTIVETIKRLERINNSKEKIEILFFNNCLSYFLNVLCEIPDTDIKISTMNQFISQIKYYNKNIFNDMKKSKYFPTFLKQNNIKESTYDLLDKEDVIGFQFKYKNDSISEKNEMYLKEICELNQIVEQLEKERIKIAEINYELNEKNIALKNEIENIKKSTSWKITKPIRMLKLMVSNIGRK